ncbi:MAG: hypothetical protein HWE27_00530 [Gammaproteobacteria bacterium]|nr:hypothetical protein [Gammaproteobacteria bacterium]
MFIRAAIIIIFAQLFLTACGGSSNSSPETPVEPENRSFYMGFTPWLYEATLDAQSTTYTRLATHGDIVKHHLQAGVPWEEAYAGTAYHPNVEAEIEGRLSNTANNLTVFLAIDSLNVGRDALADNWGESTNMPLPGEWASRSWSSPEVIAAYVNFASDMIDRFQPTYFEYGTEAGELIVNDVDGFDDYLIFASAVYTELKTLYPNLQLITSTTLKTPGSNNMNLIIDRYDDLMAFTDVLGVSVYPYVFFDHNNRGDPNNLPVNWLSQATTIANGKPIAISETGWIGENLSIPEYSYAEQSDASKQNAFVVKLLEESNTLNAEFVIWWTIADYDALWNDTLAQDPLAKIWKDIGLYDESQMPRTGLSTWDDWLSRTKN